MKYFWFLILFIYGQAQVFSPVVNLLVNAKKNSLTQSHLVKSNIDLDDDQDILSMVYHNEITVFNNDSGVFRVNQTIALGNGESFLMVDWDGDNYEDVLIPPKNDGPIMCAFNDRSGRFLTPVPISISIAGVSAFEVEDINDDNKAEAFVYLADSDSLVFLVNDGNGFLGDMRYIKHFQNNPEGLFIQVKDIDRDDRVELLFSKSNEYFIWRFDQSTTNPMSFNSPSTISTSEENDEFYIADLDSSGNLDLVTRSTGDGLDVIFNSASFGNENIGDRSRAVDIVDFDGDGVLDIVAHNYDFVSSSADKPLLLFANSGNGNIETPDTLFSIDAIMNGLALDDYDNDGDIDIVFQSTEPFMLHLYVNDGANQFSFHQDLVAGSITSPGAVFPIDIDNDGDQDVLIHSMGTGELIALINDSNGDLGISRVMLDSVNSGVLFQIGDLNNDNLPDLVMKSVSQDSIKVYINLNGTFNYSVSFELNDQSGLLDLVDIDEDGDLDIVSGSFVQIFKNTDGDFEAVETPNLNEGYSHYHFTNIDNLPGKDLILVKGSNANSYFVSINEGDFDFRAPSLLGSVQYSIVGLNSSKPNVISSADFFVYTSQNSNSEDIDVFAFSGFTPSTLKEEGLVQTAEFLVSEFDQDGIQDYLSVGRNAFNGNREIRFRSGTHANPFHIRSYHVEGEFINSIDKFIPFDPDGDHDLDLIIKFKNSEKLVWVENITEPSLRFIGSKSNSGINFEFFDNQVWFETEGVISIKVFNSLGKLSTTSFQTVGTLKFSFKDLPLGIYYIEVQTNSTKIHIPYVNR